MVNDVARLVEDGSSGKDDHGGGEPKSEAEALNKEGGSNETHRNESNDF